MATDMTRRRLIATGVGAGLVRPRRARAQTPTIRIGVLTALSGEYTDAAGGGSVVAARLGVEDFVRDYKPAVSK